MSTTGKISVRIEGSRNNGDPDFGGALTVEHAVELRFKDGDSGGSGQIDRIFQGEPSSFEIPAGSFLDIDLQALATKPDATLSAQSIRAFLIQADSDNTVAISVRPGASDPWQGWFLNATSEFALGPGDFVAVGGAVGFPVSPTDKVLRLVNVGASIQRARIVLLAAT
jgi:hypothetical protein